MGIAAIALKLLLSELNPCLPFGNANIGSVLMLILSKGVLGGGGVAYNYPIWV